MLGHIDWGRVTRHSFRRGPGFYDSRIIGSALKVRTIHAVASATGLVVLVAMVSVAAANFAAGRHFWVAAIAGYLFTVPFATATWSGTLWKRPRGATHAPTAWRDWLGLSFVGCAVSALFITIDVAVVHPGISLAFTIGAVSFSFVALAGAVRAWVLEVLSRRRGHREEGRPAS